MIDPASTIPHRPDAPIAPPVRVIEAMVVRLLLGLCLVLAGPSLAASQDATEGEAASEQAPGIPIDFTLAVPEDTPIGEALEGSLVLVQRADEPPTTPLGLIRRVNDDVGLANQALRALGYYLGQVSATIGGQAPDAPGLLDTIAADQAAGTPVAVAMTVDPGPRYAFGELVVDLPADAPEGLAAVVEAALELEAGQPAVASDILSAESRMAAALRDAGHPFASVPARRAVVDHDRQTMDVTFTVRPGPVAVMGSVTIQGTDTVEADFLQNRVPFEQGAPYRPERLADLRGSLNELGVFSTIRIEQADQLGPDGTLALTATVEDQPRRFIGFGASFATSEGVDARVFWGHRNLFGRAERLRIDAAVGRLLENDFSEIDYSVGASFLKPDFLTRDQTLQLDLALIEENPDAFSRFGVEASAIVTRRFNDLITYDFGVTAEISEIDEDEDEDSRQVGLIGIPLGVAFDSTDDALNPTEGARLNVRLTPYPLTFADSDPFLRTDIRGSAYYDILGDDQFVLAARGRLGSIVGAPLTSIPDNSRFFSGGGGSVRGFPFQGVGPEDADGDPLGGRSLIEGGLELRWRFLDDFGLVPFIDAGGVFESAFPDFDEDIDVGVGVGLRYYSPIGPLRLDIGTPLTGDDEDAPVQLYISIGQAF